MLVGFTQIRGFADGTQGTRSLTPVFLTERGLENGRMIGTENGPAHTPVKVRDGYAVVPSTSLQRKKLKGLRITFMRIRENLQLDVSDRYESGWIPLLPERPADDSSRRRRRSDRGTLRRVCQSG